ncbi:hypothetical protein Trydic_g19051 [Trypoxylus dichotomus]
MTTSVIIHNSPTAATHAGTEFCSDASDHQELHFSYKIKKKISEILSHPCLWDNIDRLAAFRAEKDIILKTEKQEKKTVRLRQNQETVHTAPEQYEGGIQFMELITMKSSRANFLERFQLCNRSNNLPVEKTVSGDENAISILEPHTAEIVRQKVCIILTNMRPPKKNLRGAEDPNEA